MPLNLISIDEKIRRVKGDIARELPGSNPFAQGLLNALSLAIAGISDEISTEIEQLLNQIFLTSASGDFLNAWGSIVNLPRKAQTAASGAIVVTGVIGTIVPVGTVWNALNNVTYVSDQTNQTISAVSVAPSSIVRTGNTATVTTTLDHKFATGQVVTISGADQPEYNGDFTITVNNINEFDYTVSGTPATPATGSLLARTAQATILVTSQTTGQRSNADSGQTVTVAESLPGLDNTGFVALSGIQGGFDAESEIEYRSRVQQAFANTPSAFSIDDIIRVTLEVPQVTRVQVLRATPGPGKVTVYFVTDNADSIAPTAEIVNEVKQKIVDIADITMQDPGNDIIVSVPDFVPTSFTFDTLVPNTSTMKSAIESNLAAFFKDGVKIGQSVDENEYNSAIFNTIDPNTGASVESFSTNVSGTLTITDGQLATFGGVSYDV